MSVGERDRLVERVEARDPDDRAERLDPIEVVIGPDAVDDRGVIEEASFGIVADEAFARRRSRDPSDRARAVHVVMIADQLEPVLEPRGEALIDHRTVDDVARGVADRRLGNRLREPIDEVVVDVAMHDRRPERGAPLAGGAEPAEQRALHSEVQICVGHHDQRVLPAELEARGLQVSAAELTERFAHGGRPREAHLVDDAFVQRAFEPGERLGSVRQHHLEGPLRDARVQDELRERLGDRGRVLRGFPHDGVPAQEPGHQVPRGHRDREVPGRDDGGDPNGHPKREELLVRHLRWHRHAVEPPPLAEEERAGVDDLLDLAPGLLDRLADLVGDQPSERLGVVLDEPPQLLDRTAAHGRGD